MSFRGIDVPGKRYNETFLSREELDRLLRENNVRATDINKILDAYEMAESVHEYQKRLDKTPYFWHPSRVARIVIVELNQLDVSVICAALLHDTLEDSNVLTPEILALNFGEYTSYLVQKLTKDIKVEGALREMIEKEYVQRLMVSSEDARMLKLADRLDTFRCLEFSVKRNPIRYIMETQQHYFPLAQNSESPRLKYLIKELQKEQNKFLG